MSEVTVGKLPFREAIKHIQDKLLIPSRQWENTIGPINAKAFTVAGATKLSLVQDLYQTVQNGILDGTTLNTFRKDFDNIVARHGWSYNGKRGWRTNVIFTTNKRTAYMAGKWEQFVRQKKNRPHLMYLTAGDERVREEHDKWNRRVMHIDDPAWKTIFPPNGWLCRCTVRSLAQDDLDEMGITPEKIGKVEQIDFNDPKTGEIIKKTPGVDIGWDYNVGKEWLAPDALLGRQLMDMPADLRTKATKWFDNDVYDKPFKSITERVALQLAKAKRISSGEAQPVGFLSEKALGGLISRGQVPVGLSVLARDKDIAHWLRDSKADRGKALPVSIASQLPQIFRKPDAILYDNESPTLIYAKKLADGQYAKFVLKLDFKAKLRVNKSRFNETLNTFVSAGLVDWSNLNGPRFEVIQGEIKP